MAALFQFESIMDTSTGSRSSSFSLNSSLERMEIEDEPPFADENDDAEYGEHHQLFGGSEDGDAMDEHTSSGLDLVQSEWCCSRYLPRSNLGRLLVFVSAACNVYLIVLLSAQTTSTSRRNGSTNRTAPCAVLLSTFPNSGTTWTQAMFKASTGVVSLAVYPEGPPTPFSTHTFAHGQVGGEYRLPDPDHGECLFVKSHARVPAKALADGSPDQLYQRAVVLYRDTEDNLHANLRYLTKLHGDNKKELLELCSYDPNGRPLPADTSFEDWDSRNMTDYASLIDLHRLAHRRFYYHAERYPVPKIIITYARLLSEPFETFRDIMMFSGYADADIDRALQENPPRSHEVHGSLDYVPDYVPGITEDELNRQFRVLWKDASPCVKRAAKILQFT